MDPAEQLGLDGAVLLRDFAGEDDDLTRLFGKEVQEVSGPVDFVAGSHAWPDSERYASDPSQIAAFYERGQVLSWSLAPGDVAVSHGNTIRLNPHNRVTLRPELGGRPLWVARAAPFALCAYQRNLFELSGFVLLRSFIEPGGDVRDAVERVFGQPVAEVGPPVDYVSRSFEWVDVWRNFADIGELHETMQIISWDLQPGDVAVSHGHALRLKHRPHWAAYDDDERAGGDLDGLHVGYV
ncbi:hypothetical protein OM076_35335 [Solirubrobacter ginsenosidimutans]|uniref:Uncharacterized protein n=1 Tax=Solirubrobacter ginsenosidimutans TaxID=490573 RepID=A0A9X3N1I9_9ACTN|nr:hypothetical protein [Solirubrobacter ginsenosidimutans]MDA0165596.1 hypothetical protein [Solirubrobacter ginsenosidimutans]